MSLVESEGTLFTCSPGSPHGTESLAQLRKAPSCSVAAKRKQPTRLRAVQADRSERYGHGFALIFRAGAPWCRSYFEMEMQAHMSAGSSCGCSWHTGDSYYIVASHRVVVELRRLECPEMITMLQQRARKVP
ncbi:unnamed protein product [Effrenium voratum]|nr:unnamed protein product [Effrenium voratum]